MSDTVRIDQLPENVKIGWSGVGFSWSSADATLTITADDVDIVYASGTFNVGTMEMPALPHSDPHVAGRYWVDPTDEFVIKQSQG